MQRRYLFAFDFDGTLFRTFDPSPNGMDVNKAYENAFNDILGSLARAYYKDSRHQNRTPYELVREMFEWLWDRTLTINGDALYYELMRRARKFLEMHSDNLGPLIPEANGRIVWNTTDPIETITQLVVGQKLWYLLDEIGETSEGGFVWPQPTAGALDFLNAITTAQKEGIPIDTAVISSGHEMFIRKTFGVWELQQPEVLVTDDDIRNRTFPKELSRKFKPGKLPLALTHYKWLQQQGFISHELNADSNALPSVGLETRSRIIYFGDDPYKDGLMANGGGVQFGWYYEVYASRPHDEDSPGFFTHWTTLTHLLTARKELFDGRPIAKIFPRSMELEREGIPAYARERR